MTRTRLRNSLIICTVGFLLGWVITQPIFSAWRDAIKIAGPPPVPTLGNPGGIDYQTYALVLLDDANNPHPVVQGVWLAWVPSNHSSLDIIGLSPESFQNQYSQNLKGLAPEAVRLQTRGSFVGSLVLDQAHLKDLVNRLGGIYLLGQKSDGDGVLQYINSDPGLPTDDRLVRQGAVIQGVLAQFSISGKNLDLPILLSIPQTNVDRNILLEVVGHYYPLNMEIVKIRAKPMALGEAASP